MKFLGLEISFGKKEVAADLAPAPEPASPAVQETIPAVNANVYTPAVMGDTSIAGGYVWATYDGENDMGEMGPAKIYTKNFYSLRVRSKQLYLESPICFAGVNRFTMWAVGKGLTLKAEPQKAVLRANKIDIDTEAFNNRLEALWKVYSMSTMADYCGQQNFHALCEEAHREAKLGGDMLVILRVIRGVVKVQHVDGRHIGNPPGLSVSYSPDEIQGSQSAEGYDYIYPPTGNRIRQGVEIDAQGQHVAYHVRVGIALKYERVVARDRMGFLRAYMYYSFKPELDATRGTPLMTVVMQTAKVLQRYNDAALAGVEERANLPFFFVHGTQSEQEQPMQGRLVKANIAQPPGGGGATTGIAIDAMGNKIAQEAAVSTKRTVINLPNDVKPETFDSKQEADVPGFSRFNIDVICAAINIPPNVAMSKYEDSFSASRMAGKDWEHTFTTEREDFAQAYITPVHALQVYIWVLQNKVEAPGLLNAIIEGDQMTIQAYLYSKWNGDAFPDNRSVENNQVCPFCTWPHIRPTCQ